MQYERKLRSEDLEAALRSNHIVVLEDFEKSFKYSTL